MDASNSILDALMLQVEVESGASSQPPPSASKPTLLETPSHQLSKESPEATQADDTATSHGLTHIADDGSMDLEHSVDPAQDLNKIQMQAVAQANGVSHDASQSITSASLPDTDNPDRVANGETPQDTTPMEPVVEMETEPATGHRGAEGNMGAPVFFPAAVDPLSTADSTAQQDVINHAETNSAALRVDAIPSDNAGIPETGGDAPEWEIDSSPYESSDSDSSSDTTSSDDDSDDDADGDYAMLDPEEAARILMQGDGGSDDEGGRSKDKPEGSGLRTANEKFEEVIPKPDITITEDMKIEELGNVEFVVENTIVIKAKTSGEYQVLETGSLICLNDRSVVGVVADLIGRVEEPRYTIRFTNERDIEEAGVSNIGTTVHYVPQHSTFVFTQPLKSVKGSDASNFHDEEVGDDEMEFSDDEAEAEHKRQIKLRRQGRTAENGRGRGGSKFSRGGHRGGRGGQHGPPTNSGPRDLETPQMNYDDVADGAEDGYTPLQRPDNLSELLANGPPPLTHPLPPPPSLPTNRSDFNDRGRGYGRGGRGGRGGQRPPRGRGGFNQGNSSTWNRPNNMSYQSNANGNYPQQNGTMTQMPQLNLPNTPSISPHNVTYPPMSPSPITPLPHSSFNFNAYQPAANFGFSQSSQNFPLSNPSIPGLGAPPLQNLHHQYNTQQHNHQAHFQSPNPATAAPGQPGLQSGPWANNPAFVAEFHRQVQEQRRNQGQGQ
ncbi:uncharacterized protein A1O9_02573 [Exophiala aquamarina CBS 119918]|uniref:H/ACA ribonucleoprotein complex non-core subunit NAF1 n=1 Tax=Exophiala aquamarina CBS 119918 TaxID=1182545 RepID=A0A072PLN2_9EURO|nr:uncharacterized protein A1O9_02573 [Exophiala aquamarina CBS 119918]KEF61009.1 hypothetical protein A1O9_02573 [Exophiala aquamarina CBS 119918]